MSSHNNGNRRSSPLRDLCYPLAPQPHINHRFSDHLAPSHPSSSLRIVSQSPQASTLKGNSPLTNPHIVTPSAAFWLEGHAIENYKNPILKVDQGFEPSIWKEATEGTSQSPAYVSVLSKMLAVQAVAAAARATPPPSLSFNSNHYNDHHNEKYQPYIRCTSANATSVTVTRFWAMHPPRISNLSTSHQTRRQRRWPIYPKDQVQAAREKKQSVEPPCTHISHWRQLRVKLGVSHLICDECKTRWRMSTTLVRDWKTAVTAARNDDLNVDAKTEDADEHSPIEFEDDDDAWLGRLLEALWE